MLRRTLGIGLALLLLPGSAARASEADLSFVAAISAGLFMLVGGGLCFAEGDEPSEYARDGPYLGLGGSFGVNNFQQKGGLSSLTSLIPPPGPIYPPPPSGAPNFYVNPPDANLGAPLDFYNPPLLSGKGPVGAFVGRNDDAATGAAAPSSNTRCGTVHRVGAGQVFTPVYQGPNCVLSSDTYVRQTTGVELNTNGQPKTDMNFETLSYGADEPGSYRIDKGNSPGVNVRAGYRCHPRAAHELDFEWLTNKFETTGTTIGFVTTDSSGQVITTAQTSPANPLSNYNTFVQRVRQVNSDIGIWTIGVNTKLFLRKERVQPYVLGGLGVMQVNEKSDRYTVAVGGVPVAPQYVDSARFANADLAARIGGGIDIYATKNLVFSLEGTYVRPTGSVEGYDYVSFGAGIQWRFGGASKSED